MKTIVVFPAIRDEVQAFLDYNGSSLSISVDFDKLEEIK
jgi:regulator of sigma D